MISAIYRKLISSFFLMFVENEKLYFGEFFVALGAESLEGFEYVVEGDGGIFDFLFIELDAGAGL